MERWRDWKFGMRIHLASDSVRSVDASVAVVGSSPEFQKIYFTLYEVFIPLAFDAGQWADLAERAGMKYFVMPTRHADGFSMYDTKTRVKSVRRVAAPVRAAECAGDWPTEPCYQLQRHGYSLTRRIVAGALVEAFRQRGLGLGSF